MCDVVCVGCEYAERLRRCEGEKNAGVGDEGGMVAVSAVNEYAGVTHGSCIVSNAAVVQGMNVGRGMRGVGGVCDMCMCLARASVGGVRVSG